MTPRLPLLGVLITVVLGLSAGVALAAFSATTSNGSNSFTVTSAPDTTAPTISRAVAAKTSGATPGTIRQGGAYYVYAQVTDAGTISSVTANTSTVDTGVTATALTTAGGPWTVGGLSYNYRSAQLTSDTPQTTGTSNSFSVSATDASSNSDTQNYTVSIETYAATILGTSGIVSHWRMNDGVVSADEMTGSNTTVLTSHTGAVGATWTRWVNDSITGVITDANRVRRDASAGGVSYYVSAVPASANYAVSADVQVKSLLAADDVGVIGRIDLSNTNGIGTHYLARYDSSTQQWQLRKNVDNVGTSLGTYGQVLSTGVDYRLTLEMNGSTIRLLVNGVERVNVTDSTITGTGRAGVRLGAGGASAGTSNTAGLHLDNFRISTLTTTTVDGPGTNNGTYTNGPYLNEPGALVGDTDRAVQFDGANDYVTVPDNNTLDLGNGPLSAEAWVMRHDAVGSTWDDIFQKGTAAYQIGFFGPDYSLVKDGTAVIVGAAGSASDLTAFHHWVATKNGTTSKLYRDGVDVTGTVTDQTLSNTATALFIAAKSGTSEFLNATLDELAIYNAELPVATVLDHYNAGKGTG
jgi:hypothetical protein